jgi:uncharacterized protein YuzE
MRITYDPEADALYIAFQKATVAETHQVNDDIAVDLDEQGHIVGLEVLFASQQIPRSELFSLVFEDLTQTTPTSP